MWHNQRVINTPNHRYNYASDPRAIAVPLVTSASGGRYLPLWVMWTLSTVRATSLSKAETAARPRRQYPSPVSIAGSISNEIPRSISRCSLPLANLCPAAS